MDSEAEPSAPPYLSSIQPCLTPTPCCEPTSTIWRRCAVAALLDMLMLERSRFFVQVALLKSADHPPSHLSCHGHLTSYATLSLAGCSCHAPCLSRRRRAIERTLSTRCTRWYATSSGCLACSSPGASYMPAPTAQEGQGGTVTASYARDVHYTPI